MPATASIADSRIRENIIRAVGDVFKTMLGRTAQLAPADPSQPLPASGAAHVVGTVGFIGDANGLIYLYFDEVLAYN